MNIVEESFDLLSGIKGLDIVNGLRRVLGNKQLYFSMLRMFVDGQKSVMAEIIKALEDKDWETAERIAHTLKGITGSIAATGLQVLAKNLNDAIKERQPRNAIDERLDELKISLNDLIAQLEQKLPKAQYAGSVCVEPLGNVQEGIG